jgi:hypothetical protein
VFQLFGLSEYQFCIQIPTVRVKQKQKLNEGKNPNGREERKKIIEGEWGSR